MELQSKQKFMNRILFFLTLLGLFLFSSCIMRKIEYVKDMSPDSIYNIKVTEALKIQPEDRLSILVLSKNIELAAPFNTNLGGYKLIDEAKVVDGVNTTNSFGEGYLVDAEGTIDFPIFGKIKVAGMSMDELEKHISTMLKENNYIEDPEIKVNLLNFKIMTMGNISNSIIQVQSGKITLLEAIVKSGGLKLDSDARSVRVIREEGGKQKLLVVDMEQYDMFNSEAYHLKQNDIVYVPQKYAELSPGTRSIWQVVGMVIGVVTLGITSVALFRK